MPTAIPVPATPIRMHYSDVSLRYTGIASVHVGDRCFAFDDQIHQLNYTGIASVHAVPVEIEMTIGIVARIPPE